MGEILFNYVFERSMMGMKKIALPTKYTLHKIIQDLFIYLYICVCVCVNLS